MVLPVLMLGSFSLLLKSFPLNVYQKFISYAFSGAFFHMMDFVYDATYGLLSLYIAFSIAFYAIRSEGVKHNYAFVGGLTAAISFFILSGVEIENFDVVPLGLKGMFVAIFCAIIVSKLYVIIINNVKIPFRLYADGIDLEFNDAIIAMIPSVSLVLLFASFNYLICMVCDVNSFSEIYLRLVTYIFRNLDRTFICGFLYVVVSSILWFFGIHGTDVLGSVSDRIFNSGLSENISAYVKGNNPNQILTSQFFEQFVLLGGCGATICLLFTIAIFSKRRINRNLAKISAFPMVFNINELMMFGYPIIFNPYLFAPFLVTPVVAYCVSYMAMYMGWVPVITHDVEWTTPIIFSGYKATGSIAGAILQVVVVMLGIFIYMPFVKMYDKSKMRSEKERIKELTDILKKAEEDNEEIHIMELPGIPGTLAKCLAADLRNAIEDKEIKLYYQLQYNNQNVCIGAETLLRYNHPIHGFIYPPLVIKIAEESGILSKLERYLFTEAAIDYRRIKNETSRPYKISVNVTIATILESNFMTFLENLKKDYNIDDGEMCIEITEQMAIKSDAEFERALDKVKELGFMIAIDDFSMGSTSIKYLQKNQFDIVKLDGSIVKAMMTNERSKDIISSIVYLAKSLNFKVLAEYVETEEQRQMLEDIGCSYYQGYHFSKSVDIEEFLDKIQ